MLGTWRKTKTSEWDGCPLCVENTLLILAKVQQWVNFSLPRMSLTSLREGPGKCLRFLNWWWPCQKAAFYKEDVVETHQLPLFSWREKRKFEEKTETCVRSSSRVSACLLYHSLQIETCWCPYIFLFPDCFFWNTSCMWHIKNKSSKLPFLNVYYMLKVTVLHFPHSADHDV